MSFVTCDSLISNPKWMYVYSLAMDNLKSVQVSVEQTVYIAALFV